MDKISEYIIYEGPGTKSAEQLRNAYLKNGGKPVEVFVREVDFTGKEELIPLYLDGDGRERDEFEADWSAHSVSERKWYENTSLWRTPFCWSSGSVKLPCLAPKDSVFDENGNFHNSVQTLVSRINRMGLEFSAEEIVDRDVKMVYWYAERDIAIQNLTYQIDFWCCNPGIKLEDARNLLHSHLDGCLNLDSKHPLHHKDMYGNLIALKGLQNAPFPANMEDVFERKTLQGENLWVRKLQPCVKKIESTKMESRGMGERGIKGVQKKIAKKNDLIPRCKTCGKKAIRRYVKKLGPNKGREFWGCDFNCRFFEWIN